MASIDELDDESLLKLIQKRQEEAALRDRSLNERSQLGGIIAGLAGGIEAGMRGESGSQGALRGLESVDAIRRRSLALQADEDTKATAPLLKIAQLRAEKQKRAEMQQDAMERLKAQSEYQLARERELLPMKSANDLARLAFMSGDKRAAERAQRELEMLRQGETGRRFDITEQRRADEFAKQQERLAAESAHKQAQFDAQMKAKQDELDKVTKRLMDLEGIRQGGATKRAEIGAAAKAAPKAAGAGKAGGAVKPPSAEQMKAAGFGRRAILAEGELNAILETGFDPTTWKSAGQQALPSFLEGFKSDDVKGYEQAKRNFISAVLRKESGAAISDQEYQNEDRKYFPQQGDTINNVKQKERARQQAVENLKAEAANAWDAIPQVSSGASASVTRVINGVTYQKVPGGWQKVK